jgi:hypothetical protein
VKITIICVTVMTYLHHKNRGQSIKRILKFY